MRRFIFLVSTFAATALHTSCAWPADGEKSNFEAVGSFVVESKFAERTAIRVTKPRLAQPLNARTALAHFCKCSISIHQMPDSSKRRSCVQKSLQCSPDLIHHPTSGKF